MTREANASPPVSIDAVIVSFESGPLLHDLLASLARAEKAVRDRISLRVTIVDNASSEPPSVVALESVPTTWLRLERNVGYGAAINLGAVGSRGDWLLLLNQDVQVSDDFFERLLVERLDLPANAAMLGPALLNADGTHQPSVGRFPTLFRTLFDLARPRVRRKYSSYARHRWGRVDWATGACLLVRRDCWEWLSGFDAGFFLYYEDVDLCLRARLAGFDTYHVPSLRVSHLFPTAQRRMPAELVPVVRGSQLRWFRLHRSRVETRLLGWLVRLWTRLCAAGLGRSDVDWEAVRVALDRSASSEPASHASPPPRVDLVRRHS